MNPNYKPTFNAEQISVAGVENAKFLIIETIKNSQQTFWPEIKKSTEKTCSFEEVQEAKRQLLVDGVIRMKEDSSEHDWEWILIK